MKRVFIFAIGGTGSRVLRSLSMLLAAGVEGMNDLELVPVIVDYDVANGDKGIATQCLETYCLVHNQVKKTEDAFFMTKVSKLRDVAVPGGGNPVLIQSNNFDVYFGPVNTNRSFAEEIKYNEMTHNMDCTHSLLEALYNDLPEMNNVGQENKDTELNLNLKKGFKGNPNIGSVIFNQLKETEEFKHFTRVFDPVTDKVFIISSIFGGTGSSGFPEIVKSIRTSNNPGVRNACMGAVVVLPYFKIQNTGGAIDSNNFNSKTKAALSYYASSGLNKELKSIYYIGDSNATQLADHDGEEAQKNTAHIVELLSALSIIDFCTSATHQEAYEYGIQSNADTLTLANFYENESIQPHFNYLTRFAYMVKYYRDVLQGKRKSIASNESFYAGLHLNDKIKGKPLKDFEDFVEYFEKWLEELGMNAHKFQPYILDSKSKLTQMLSHKPLIEHRFRPDQLSDGDFTRYLNNAFSPERANLTSDKEIEVFFKIMRKATSDVLNQVNNIKNK